MRFYKDMSPQADESVSHIPHLNILMSLGWKALIFPDAPFYNHDGHMQCT